MYTRFFGLTAEPFSLSPDPNFFFLSAGHANALAALKIGIRGRRGLLVMTGEVGTGKTTLLYSLLGDIGPRVHTAYLSNTKLSFDGMLRLALADFGIPCPGQDRADMLSALNAFLRRCAEQRTIAALIVDEAQNLDEDTFEHIRLLSNFETLAAKLLQIILVGQPELEFKLRQPSLRQVAERVAVRCHLEPLSRKESEAYLAHRLRKVDAQPGLFTVAARRVILRAAQGIPRRINILCDNALLFAYGREVSHVSKAEARLAIRERAALLARPPLLSRSWRTLHGPASVGMRGVRLAVVVLLLIAAAGAMHWWDNWSGLGSRVAATGTTEPAGDSPEIPVASVPAHAIEPPASQPESLATSPLPSSNVALAASQVAVARSPDQPAAAGGRALEDGQLVEAPTAEQARGVAPVASIDRVASPPVASTSAEPLRSDSRNDTAGPRQSHLATAPGSEDLAAESAPLRAADDSLAFRSVRVAAGSTLSSLTREVYGLVDPGLIARIQSANPHVVNPDHILAGDTLRFPEVDQRTGRPAKDHQ